MLVSCEFQKALHSTKLAVDTGKRGEPHRLVDVVLLVGGLGLGVGHVARDEFAELRRAVLLGAAGENALSFVLLGVVSGPGLENGVLKRAGVGEGHVPGVGLLVHGVEVQGGVELGEATREEHDACGGGGDAGIQHA